MFKKILVALKFSPGGLHALHAAADLARTSGAELVVFNALDYHLKALCETDPRCTAAVEEAHARFTAEAEPFLAGLDRVSFICRPADPSVEFCRLARDTGADLAVFGCHQRPGLAKSRIDYTGMTILETAPCAVMLVPYVDGEPL
jgi:nucleotide-binding universal stress UspA family protein